MSNVIVEIDASEFENLLTRLQERVGQNGLRSFLAIKALREVRHRIEARFAMEGDDATGKWEQLAWMTQRIRAFQGFSPRHPINVRTGAMRRHLLTSFRINAMGGSGATLVVPGNDGNATMNAKVAMAQQGGWTRQSNRFGGPNRHVPARPVLGVSERDADKVGDLMLDWIRSGISI
jgi:hypothetical protein